MENDGLPKTASDPRILPLNLLPSEDPALDKGIARPQEMRGASTELPPPLRSIHVGAASTSHADPLVDRNVILSVIRALQEKQRYDSASGANSGSAEVFLKADKSCIGATFSKDVNLLASRGVSLQPPSDVSMQLSGEVSVQSSRDFNIQPLRDLSIRWSKDVNVQPVRDANLLPRDANLLPRDANLLPRDANLLPRDSNLLPRDSNLLPRDANLLPRDPKVMPTRDVGSLACRDVNFQPSKSAKIRSFRDATSLTSDVSFQSSRSASSRGSKDVAFMDKISDFVHSSKRRRAAVSDRDGGDSSDSSSRELFTGRTSAAYIPRISYDITRRHTDSPSSSCSSSLSSASSPGPNSAHSGDVPHRLPKDLNGGAGGVGGVPSSGGEDVFQWAHSMMAEPVSAATTSATCSPSKLPSEKNSSTSRFPLRQVSPKSSLPPVSPKSSFPPVSPKSSLPPVSPKSSFPPVSPKSSLPPVSPKSSLPPVSPKSSLPTVSSPNRVLLEFNPQKVPLESSSRPIAPEFSPRRVLPESSPRRVLSESSHRVPTESSPRFGPLEPSPHRIPHDSSPRRILPEFPCRINTETCAPLRIPLESSPRQGVRESSPRCVLPDFHGVPGSPPMPTNNPLFLTKQNFDTSSSDSLLSKFEQRSRRTNEPCEIPSPEKSPSFTTRTTSSCSVDQRSTNSSPRNQSQFLEAGSSLQIDTTEMTVDEILQFIRVPKFSNHEPDHDKLKEFLDPHEIGHMNHLIKCFSDAIFSVTFPENVVEKNGFSPLDVLDLYCCSIIRLYHLSFKNLDFINLQPDDQLALLKNFALKGILCMAFFIFKEETNSWVYPTGLYNRKLLEIRVPDMNQLLPYNHLQRILAMNVVSAKLGIDWPMGMLLIGAFFYCPIDVEIQNIEKIDKLRDRYMEILFKYLKWKHGPTNASLCFPEILKLMDAVLKQCSDLEHLNLALKEEEIKSLEERIKTLSASCSSDQYEEETRDSPDGENFTDGVTFSKINNCILNSVRNTVCHSLVLNGSLDLRRCAAVPTASMYYSNLPLESEEAKSRREVEAMLLQKILERNRASNDLPVSSSSNQSCVSRVSSSSSQSASLESAATYARPQAVNALAIQRLLLNLARKDLDVVSKQEPGLPVLLNQKTSPLLPETSGSSQSAHNSLHQSSLMTSVFPRGSNYPPFTDSVPVSHPKPNAFLAEVTVTRKSSPVPTIPHHEDNSHFTSAIDLSKRPRLSSNVSTTSTRSNTPSVPELKPLANFHTTSRSPSISSPSTESPMDLGLDERTRLVALFNEVKKVGACRTEGDTGDFRNSSILTSSQIEVLLETLGRSRIRYRNTDP